MAAKNNVIKNKNINAISKTINDLSSKKAFLILLKSMLNFNRGNFLYFQKENNKTKFKIENRNKFVFPIASNKDNISIFRTISAKYAIKIIIKFLPKEAIKYELAKFNRIQERNIF